MKDVNCRGGGLHARKLAACQRLGALPVLALNRAMHHGEYLSLPTLGSNHEQASNDVFAGG